MGELRELSNLEEDFDEAASEEVNCFSGVEAVADVGSLEVNHSDNGRGYFSGNANFRGRPMQTTIPRDQQTYYLPQALIP